MAGGSDDIRYDLIGLDALHGAASVPVGEPYEVRLRVAARAATEGEAWRVAREVESLYTNGPAGGGGASTVVKPVLAMRSTLMPRTLVPWQCRLRDRVHEAQADRARAHGRQG